MVEYFRLDKTFVQGTTYTLPSDRFYVIKKIGTDQTSDTHLKIDGVDTGKIISDIAPLRTKDTNRLGVLELGDLYYVVPPDKKFTVEGASGAKMLCKGLIGKLAPGESMPANYATRFNAQGKHYLTYIKGTVTLAAAGATWADGDEKEVISLTPKTIETYILNNVAMALVENPATAISGGQVGIIFYLEGTPFDILTTDPGKKGIEILSMPYPPKDDTEQEAFTMAELPITVPGDNTLSIRAMNVSGAGITAATGADMTCKACCIVEYKKS